VREHRSLGPCEDPPPVQQRLRERLGVGRHRHRLGPRPQTREVGRDGAAAQAGVLEDPVGQGRVVEGLDLEGHDPDVGAEHQACGRLVLQAPQPHEVRGLATEGEVGIVLALLVVPGADEQQHEPVAEALAHEAQQRPVGPPAEVADRDRDDVAAVRRGERVGGERHGDRAPAGEALDPRELVGHGDDRRRALGRPLVQDVQPLALGLAGVVGALEAIPAPVPQLAAGRQGDDRARQLVLQRVEDHDHARLAQAAAQRAHEAPSLARRDGVADPERHPRERAIGHPRGIHGDHAVGAQQVLGLVAQDEALQWRGEQQDADRLALHRRQAS
jgi:hypothetical protein